MAARRRFLFEQLIGQGISVTPPSISTLFLWRRCVQLPSLSLSFSPSSSLVPVPLSGFNLAIFPSTWPSPPLPHFLFHSGAGWWRVAKSPSSLTLKQGRSMGDIFGSIVIHWIPLISSLDLRSFQFCQFSTWSKNKIYTKD